MSENTHQNPFPVSSYGDVTWRKLTDEHVSTTEFEGEKVLKVEPAALELLSREAFHDISHFLRSGHLEQLRGILDDPEASPNDRFVALDLLRNSQIAAEGILPMCQDTGTAIVMGKKGQNVFTGFDDEAAIAEGVARTYLDTNLRYSQVAPLNMFDEKNTGNNLPAQIELYAEQGDAYKFHFIAKGGGSANKTFLYQETKALLNPTRLMDFMDEKIRTLGTAACPPYHLAIVIGGTSPTAARPATELPAQHAEAKTRSAIASQRGIVVRGVGVSRSVTGASV